MVNALTLFVIFILLSYLVLLFNGKYLWLNHSHLSRSLFFADGSRFTKSRFSVLREMLISIGKLVAKLIPEAKLVQFEVDHLYLDRSRDQMFISIGQAAGALLVMILLYCFVSHWLVLVMVLLVPALMIAEVHLAIANTKRDIEHSVEHVVRCLKVLVIQTETPLISALETVIEDMPLDMVAMRRELVRIISKAKKTGIRSTLMDYSTEIHQFRDFVAMLISINEGASKNAMQLSIDNFLKQIDEARMEDLANKAENLQLYLVVPVTLMLIIASIPMLSAIKYLLKNSGMGL